MHPQMTWVLLRPDLTWHVLPQHARDPRGLFRRVAMCGVISPDGLLGVIAFTQAQPRAAATAGPLHSRLCEDCYEALRSSHAAIVAAALPSAMATIRPAA